MLALRGSDGFAASAPQGRVPDAVRTAAACGLYLEGSSALPFACLEDLVASGAVPRGARVVIVATSHGYTDSF